MGVTFSVLLVLVSAIVQNALISEQVRDRMREADEMATEIAPYYADANTSELYALSMAGANRSGGRIVVLDEYGVAQVDTFSEFNGRKVSHPEIEEVLSGQSGGAYGMHRIGIGGDGDAQGGALSETAVMYFVSSVVYGGRTQAALVLSVSVQDVMDDVARARQRMTLVLALALCVAVAFSFVIAGIITKPILNLTGVIERMGRGEFSQRVEVTGKSELSRLGQTFNDMSAQLERMENSRNEFVSDVSHELRTPLSAMKILVESLLYDEQDDARLRREFLGDVNKEIDRLNRIISDLLLLINIDHSAAGIKTEPCSLRELSQEVVRRLLPIAGKKNVRLSYNAGEDVWVQANALILQQAISNLVDNAIKYTPRDGDVRVSCLHAETLAVVRVEDNGIGIPEKDMEYITERFYRVDKARSRQSGGTGLGLSIVLRAVDAHGGNLNIRSVENEGTVCEITLPAVVHAEGGDDGQHEG